MQSHKGSKVATAIPGCRAAPRVDGGSSAARSSGRSAAVWRWLRLPSGAAPSAAALPVGKQPVTETRPSGAVRSRHANPAGGAALLRREVFALFMGLFARGCVSPVLISGGQQPSQRVPASFRRPAEPRNGTEYRRSVPLGRAPFWTFARRSGTVPWAGGQTCDGSDDRIPGT